MVLRFVKSYIISIQFFNAVVNFLVITGAHCVDNMIALCYYGSNNYKQEDNL